MSKLVKTLKDAILACGLKDGMTIDFNHNLRNGDYVTAMVLNTIAQMGIRDIKVCSSGIMDGMMRQGLVELVRNGTIRSVETTGQSRIMGELISRGQFKEVCKFHTHGGRPRSIINGEVKIDVSFVAAPTSDPMGNCNGVDGPNAFGSMGFSMTSTRYADKVVIITDNLVPYPLARVSIDETFVDYVVVVDSIGDPNGIATGILKPARDPKALRLAEYAAAAIAHSGLLKDGFVFQAGGGGASVATAKYIKDYMLEKQVHGSFLLGGITSHSVALLEAGCFEALLDTQCMDRVAVKSLKDNPRHREISDNLYANPFAKSCAVNNLDVVVLGALQVDTSFNANLVVDSSGFISGGAGGHSDTAAGAKMSMIVAPLVRSRYPTIVDKVTCVTTPGKDINVVITEYGIAVNPKNTELKTRFKDAGLKVMGIEDMKMLAESMTGKPAPLRFGDKVVAQVVHRDGYVIDEIHNVLD